jgi:hypothetical protein
MSPEATEIIQELTAEDGRRVNGKKLAKSNRLTTDAVQRNFGFDRNER